MAERVNDIPEEALSDAALAAMLTDPFEAGMRLALDEGVAAALPGVLGELAGPELVAVPGIAPAAARAVVVPAVAPVAEAVPAEPVPRVVPEAPAPIALMAAAERAAAGPVAVPRGLPDVPVSHGAVSRGSVPEAPAESVPAAPAVAAPVDAGRLDWGSLDWGRLAAVPAVLAAPAIAGPAAPAMADPVPASAPDWPGEVPRSAAPVAMPWGGMAPALGQVPAAEPAPRESDEPAPEGEAVIEGRLEIDGTLLGRFVAEYLGREAGRPQGGMTGFDPLVSPSWAGALQG